MAKMPVLFVGHGSPMNAIEDNVYTKSWKELAKRIPRPKAILSISAHWYTKDTKIMNEANPKTIHDNSWGIDHGTWSVLVHMYPERDFRFFKLV